MHRLIRHIVSFTLVFILFGAVMMVPAFFNNLWESLFFGPPQAGGAVSIRIPEFEQFLEDHDEIDYLFLGSSTCYRGIDPHHLYDENLVTFNLGSSSQQMMNSQWLVEMALQKAHVRTVVLDIFPNIWHLKGIEPARDHLRNNPDSHRAPFLKMAWNTRDPYTLYLYSYFGLKHQFEALAPMHAPDDDYRGLGFVYSIRQVADSFHCDPNDDGLKMHLKDRRGLRSIIQQVEGQGGNVILLIPPVKCLKAFELPEEFRQLPLIDARECPLPDSLFYDEDHLIGEGAILYTNWLSERLKALN